MSTLDDSNGQKSRRLFSLNPKANGKFLFNLSPGELIALAAVESVSSYPRHTCLFTEQRKVNGIFILHDGWVKEFLTAESGKSLATRIAMPGDVLDLPAIIARTGYHASAITGSDCTIGFVSSEKFQKFLTEHPAVFQIVSYALAMRCRTHHEQLLTRGFDSVFGRVAYFLLTLSADSGIRGDGIWLAMPFSHEEIAECTGTSRETVTRIIGVFRSRGLIDWRPRSEFVIYDHDALRQFQHGSAQLNSDRKTKGQDSSRIKTAMKAKGGGGAIYPPLDYPAWQRPLVDALTELDSLKRAHRIQIAERAVLERLKDRISLSRAETRALKDAVRALANLMPRKYKSADACKKKAG